MFRFGDPAIPWRPEPPPVPLASALRRVADGLVQSRFATDQATRDLAEVTWWYCQKLANSVERAA